MLLNRPARRPGRRGFTLIELLVVVAIIALLISILLPSLSKARETARMVRCLAIQKQYGTANIMYADANDQWYVKLNASSREGITSGGGFWGANILYRQNLGLRIGGSNTQPGSGQTCNPDLICPSKQTTEAIEKGWWYRAFAMNAMGSPGLRNRTVNSDRAVNRARVRNPSTKVMGMDAVNWSLTSSGQANPTHWETKGDTSDSRSRHVAFRHLEQTTAVMHDGHAQNLPKADTYRSSHAYRISLYDPYKN